MAFNRPKKKLMEDDEVIVLNNVSKSYQAGVQALSNVNIRIKKGEFVFVVGDSGSGKSTFIKLLLRELVPTTGSIYILDYNLNKIKHRKVPKFRRNIGVVFQDFRLLKDRNVYENVAFAQRIIEVPSAQIRKNVPKVLATVGLAGKYKVKPGRLS
ncbi:MAG: ATP-binding cassette domain-containing protein, partial [Lachnospiraceae bacterium]|nr:ATP-binding cassette domain-containing protein [Lachnospiraceae bacterium]